MDSDSDRTIDSDELEEIIARTKKEQNAGHSNMKTPDKNSKHASKIHSISDSDSDDDKIIKKKTDINTVRKSAEVESVEKKLEVANLPVCQYGSKCYRKNPDHKKRFYHPKPGEDERPAKIVKSSSPEFYQHAQNSKKYNFFVTHVSGIPPRYNMEISRDIKDLLSFKDGTLIASAQFNYMFDIEWLMQQYPEKYRKCPLTIVHGEQRESKKSLERSGSNYSNIKFCQAKLEIPFGTHHTKMMFLLYKEGFRVIIHTSNIVESDWAQKTQGMWISHLLPELKNPSTLSGESPTNFKADLLEYISSYSAPLLEEWCQIIKKHDFSKVNVVLIGSSPGRHVGSRKTAFGHLKLRKVLNLSGPSKDVVQNDWFVVGQFSSIGSLGASPDQWLRSELSSSFVTCKDTAMVSKPSCLKLIYPSVENVRKSLEGYPAGGSLPYSIKVAQKQPYLKSFLHQWKSDKLGRTEASPHIKTYFRLSPDNKKIAWFLVTSANLSKAAWGVLEKKGAHLMIRSYELGVLYLPKYFGIDAFSSPLQPSENADFFPLPYDIPLEPYSREDEPWIWDIPHIKGPDRYGNMWCPPL